MKLQGGQKKKEEKRLPAAPSLFRQELIFSYLKLDINPNHHHLAALTDAEYKFFTAKVRNETL